MGHVSRWPDNATSSSRTAAKPVETIGDEASHQEQEEHRSEQREPQQSEVQRIAGHLIEMPADRHLERLDTKDVRYPGNDEENEIPIPDERPRRGRSDITFFHSPPRRRRPMLRPRQQPHLNHVIETFAADPTDRKGQISFVIDAMTRSVDAAQPRNSLRGTSPDPSTHRPRVRPVSTVSAGANPFGNPRKASDENPGPG